MVGMLQALPFHRVDFVQTMEWQGIGAGHFDSNSDSGRRMRR